MEQHGLLHRLGGDAAGKADPGTALNILFSGCLPGLIPQRLAPPGASGSQLPRPAAPGRCSSPPSWVSAQSHWPWDQTPARPPVVFCRLSAANGDCRGPTTCLMLQERKGPACPLFPRSHTLVSPAFGSLCLAQNRVDTDPQRGFLHTRCCCPPSCTCLHVAGRCPGSVLLPAGRQPITCPQHTGLPAGYVCCFHFRANRNRAAVDILEHGSLRTRHLTWVNP